MADESRELTAEGYRFVFEAAPDGILVVDEEGRVRDLNPRIEELFGYDRHELLGREVEVLIPDQLRRSHRSHRREYAQSPHARPMGIGMLLKGRKKDGSEFPVEISLSPLRRDDQLDVIAVVRDVSERLRLRRFGARAVEAAEDERRRLARELHDDTAQRLSTVLLRLRVAAEAEGDEHRKILEEIRQEVRDTLEGVRRIARGLRPPALEDVGLVAAIRSHLRGVSDASDVKALLETGSSPSELHESLDPEQRLAVYRVIQEAVSNAVRHSGAERVVVSVEIRGSAVRAVVEDRGKGFDPADVRRRGEGLGLVGMEERVSWAEGRLELESAEDRGTRVVAEIPIRNDRRRVTS